MTQRRARTRTHLGRLGSVLSTLFLRGAGSGLAVLLTLLVSRLLGHEAGQFLLLFNVTTIAAVCFRWGLDDLIVRRVAGDDRRRTRLYLMALAHRRVFRWWLCCSGVLLGAQVLKSFLPMPLQLGHFQVALVVSAAVALTACAGRQLQGLGRTNSASFVLNILFPAALVLGLLVSHSWLGSVNAWNLILLYLAVAVSAYVIIICGVVLQGRRPRLSRDSTGCASADRRAANRLGGVVLAQQALGWLMLLVVPLAYGDAAYTSFVVIYKVAMLVNLVMLAVNFTFASRVAKLFAEQNLVALRRLNTAMLGFVAASSVLTSVGVFVLRRWFYESAALSVRPDAVLALLLGAQLFFAVAAVSGLVLSMGHQERYLLLVQGTVAAVGVMIIVPVSFVAPLWATTSVLVVAYAVLAVALYSRANRLLTTG